MSENHHQGWNNSKKHFIHPVMVIAKYFEFEKEIEMLDQWGLEANSKIW